MSIRFKSIIAIAIFIFTISTVSAQENIGVIIDGESIKYTDETGYPFIDKKYTDQTGYPLIDEIRKIMVPFRATLEKYGAEVTWDDVNKIAIAKKDGVVVEVPINENYIYKNDAKIQNYAKAVVKDGKTYLPIYIVFESFGEEISYYYDNTIRISYNSVLQKYLTENYSNVETSQGTVDLNFYIFEETDYAIHLSASLPDEVTVKTNEEIFNHVKQVQLDLKNHLLIIGEDIKNRYPNRKLDLEIRFTLEGVRPGSSNIFSMHYLTNYDIHSDGSEIGEWIWNHDRSSF
ncbi:copper amine oxidase N-terminal domain-containing protein [Vallitalea okinawensis]|uniref:copper amine oxidase N-terminal domain-containing protein n=1 Tax=Vallitalea okinawensis TaxID=2078660 RepID=UPI000CFDA3EA|nr:copper amine oxidase N-terminal domain-containing protein [Vallitalea okinawensis]